MSSEGFGKAALSVEGRRPGSRREGDRGFGPDFPRSGPVTPDGRKRPTLLRKPNGGAALARGGAGATGLEKRRQAGRGGSSYKSLDAFELTTRKHKKVVQPRMPVARTRRPQLPPSGNGGPRTPAPRRPDPNQSPPTVRPPPFVPPSRSPPTPFALSLSKGFPSLPTRTRAEGFDKLSPNGKWTAPDPPAAPARPRPGDQTQR
jgi:hypothetical protein